MPASIGSAKKALLDLEPSSLVDMGEGYPRCWVNSNYGNVEQRWLVIRSEQAFKKEEKNLEKRLKNKEKDELKAFAHKEYAQMALKELEKKCELLAFSEICIGRNSSVQKSKSSETSAAARQIYLPSVSSSISFN